ncbi:MAG: amidohydrolase family protein [Pseudomonadota bacterium]
MEHPNRIDTHQHIIPPAYRDWLVGKGLSSGGLPIPEWSEETALAFMERCGIASAVLSVSTPGTYFGDAGEARERTREVNEYCAALCTRHPEQFGFFATLTLPDLDGALSELAYAFDVLGARGVILLTSMDGVYLGDERWAPLMEELGRRSAVVFVHPNEPSFPAVPGIIPSAADFLLETTRAAIAIAKSGCLDRWPGLRVILSHAGGFVPFAAERIARVCGDGTQEHGLERLQRFYFDTALSGSPFALPSLLAFAKPDRILFGSDWPHARTDRSLYFTRLLDEFALDAATRHAIYRGNAEKLFAAG